jgi:hypothetical protein
MAFYTRLNPESSLPKDGEINAFSVQSTNPKDNPCPLRIFVNQNTGFYDYQFMKKAFILWHKDDTITFTIRNEIPNTDAVVITHLSTDHFDHGASKFKVILVDDQGQPIPDPDQAYKGKLRKVSYKLDIKPFELVHIGLIVEVISNSPGAQPEFLLCDPQVGNGPP